MLPHPTHDRLIALGLVGMAKTFEEQRQQPAVASLTFEERLGLLVDREAVERQSKRLVTRLKFASLRQNATVEDLNTRAARGLDKPLFAKLATGDWIGRRQDLLITGKTGTGNRGSPARSATRPVAMIDRCSIIASHACSTHLRWHAAMDDMHASSKASPVSSS
jgi:IstB-like ATP binding protein